MIKRRSLTGKLLLATILLFATTSQLFAQSPLRRLAARFQPGGEAATIAAPLPGGAGGTEIFSPVVRIPGDVNVLYITFSAQADVHNGSALLMNASVDGVLIQPLALLVPGPVGTVTGWYSLLKLPAPTTSTNCNDGGGGTADCHNNNIYFSGCIRIEPGERDSTVTIKLANLPGGDENFSFLERATLYVDGQNDETDKLCTPI